MILLKGDLELKTFSNKERYPLLILNDFAYARSRYQSYLDECIAESENVISALKKYYNDDFVDHNNLTERDLLELMEKIENLEMEEIKNVFKKE